LVKAGNANCRRKKIIKMSSKRRPIFRAKSNDAI
jgi:hypothetical protein